jgi:hypothetical protein
MTMTVFNGRVTVFALAALGVLATEQATHAATLPVKLSLNGRYLVDQNGAPFFLHGDTAWSLLVALNQEESERYLEDRRQRGFTAIIVNLIEHKFTAHPPNNRNGDGPFLTSGDFSTPNEAYFRHADWVIKKAEEKGLLVFLFPCYLGYGGGNEGFWKELNANEARKSRDYGRFLGTRYRRFTNIIWVHGGRQSGHGVCAPDGDGNARAHCGPFASQWRIERTMVQSGGRQLRRDPRRSLGELWFSRFHHAREQRNGKERLGAAAGITVGQKSQQEGFSTMKPKPQMKILLSVLAGTTLVAGQAETERQIQPAEVSSTAVTFPARAGDAREFTWWLPPGAEQYVLPISAGLIVQTGNARQMAWLRKGSPWGLSQLPAFGARYGERILVVIVPWPHYDELVTQDRVGVRFAFPEKRNNATPCEIIMQWTGPDPLEVARVFREWRASAKDPGAVPRARSLAQKAAELPHVSRLFGAPHFYLWGPAMFSRHDVPRNKWVPLAKALRDAATGTDAARLRGSFSSDQRRSLNELAGAEWPMNHLLLDVAQAVDAAMTSRSLLGLAETTALAEVAVKNRARIAKALAPFANPPETWGDGLSVTLLNDLHGAGIDRALLLLSDLYHLNRETWPRRKESITRHFAFWSPLHRVLATAPLVRFQWLSDDRLVQRTTFRHSSGDTTITVNFSTDARSVFPACSATVTGLIALTQRIYQSK